MNIKPKTYTKMVAFKISPQEYDILKIISEEQDKTASDLFRGFINQKATELSISLDKTDKNQQDLFKGVLIQS